MLRVAGHRVAMNGMDGDVAGPVEGESNPAARDGLAGALAGGMGWSRVARVEALGWTFQLERRWGRVAGAAIFGCGIWGIGTR